MTALSLARRSRAGAGLALAALLVTAACGGSTSDEPSDPAAAAETSLAPGAGIEEYREALAEMDPVTISAQTPGPQGSPLSSYLEEYFAAVTDWSGEKIQFEVSYSNSIVPPGEIAKAVADGRLDMGNAVPTYDPDNYPVANAMMDLAFESSQGPVVGPLQLTAWMAEVAANLDDLYAEFEGQGIYPLAPFFNSGINTVLCTEPRTALDDFDGVSTRATARVQVEQLKSLGMEAVNLDFTEVYEGLQRGVIDCANATPHTVLLGGLVEIAPHVVVDQAVGLAPGVGTFVINPQLWESLPLAARQLMHDRLDVFFQHSLLSTFEGYAELLAQVEEHGGEIRPFGEDARAALISRNREILDQARTGAAPSDASGLVDAVIESSATWHDLLTGELGFVEEIDAAGYLAWFDTVEPATFEAYTEKLFERALNSRRPA